MMKDMGYGADYAYDHDAEDGFSGQNYFPEGVERQALYAPVERGVERNADPCVFRAGTGFRFPGCLATFCHLWGTR